MSFIKAQKEARENLILQVQDVVSSALTENRGLTSEEQVKIERLEADIEARDSAISVAERTEARTAEAARAAEGVEVRTAPSSSDADIFRAMIAGEKRSHDFEKRATTPLVGSDSTVPKSFYDQVFEIARLVGPMLDTSEVFNTTSGESLTIPTLTAYSTATIKAAGSAIAESNPTFSNITLGAVKYGFLVPVANELIVDAGFDISGLIARQAGNAIGFAVNNALTLGTGTVEPRGIVTASASAVAGGTGTNYAPTYAQLVDLVYAADGAARLLPTYGLMTSKSGLAAIRKMTDSTGAFIWASRIADGQPDTVLGYRIYENPAMEWGASKKSIIAGDLASYKVRVAGGLQVATSSDFDFGSDVTTFRVTMRVDGNLTHAAHVQHFVSGTAV